MLGCSDSTSLLRPSTGFQRGGGEPMNGDIFIYIDIYSYTFLYITSIQTGSGVAPRTCKGLRWWFLTNSHLPPSLSPRFQRFGSRTAEPNGEREKGTSKPSFAKTASVRSLTASCSPTMTCTPATRTTTGQPRA